MAEKETSDVDNVVFVGSKPVMNYVQAILTVVGEGVDDVVLKARGRAISRAVDAAEVIRNRMLEEFDITDIKTGTEEIEEEEGTSNVSTISITLEKTE